MRTIGRGARVRDVIAWGVGHQIHAEAPELYAREIRGFFTTPN